MARKPAREVRKREAEAPFKTRVVCIGRWYRKLHGRTEGELDEQQAAFLREWNERRARWRTGYGIELPTNVDQWERLLSRAGLSPQEVSDVLAGIPDIDSIISHVEGYLDRVRVDSGRSDPRPSPTERLKEPLGARAGDIGEGKAPASVTRDQALILRALRKAPHRCLLLPDLMAMSGLKNRETVGRLVKELMGAGLVHRPHGERKGCSLTAAGLAAADKLS